MKPDIDYASEYDNSGRVENSADLVDQYILDAALYRESRMDHAELNIAYGPDDRNFLDIFWPDAGQDCPMVVFIHGGYWQRLDRSAFSHMASGLNSRGVAVALPSYTLCPDISIAGIITEMRRCCLLMYQTYKRPLTVVGHSAGGHLAACMMATDWPQIHPDLPEDLVQSGMAISGLFDLAPLIQTPINEALQLDLEQAIESSPVLWTADGAAQFDAWVGGDESSEFQRQSADLAQSWSMLGTVVRHVSVTGANHFTVIDQLTDAESPMVERVMELIKRPYALDAGLAPDDEAVAREMERFQLEGEKAEQGDEAGSKRTAAGEEDERPVDIDGDETPPAP